ERAEKAYEEAKKAGERAEKAYEEAKETRKLTERIIDLLRSKRED
ncbi:MAG: pneumococcal surface A domain protein, partial [Candidatus Latescibacterota bacterium]